MEGFFININCSQIFDTNEASYKIFIRKNEMSIVYELVQWIRFMFGLERCFFLVHDNSVIHELEDINVLEILNSLELRPCLRLSCIHKRMERKLFHKLNLFIPWGEIKVHKLFRARCNDMIPRNHLSLQENSDDQEEFNSPQTPTHELEDDMSQEIESRKMCGPIKFHDEINKAIASLDNKNINSNEINMPKEFSSQKMEFSAGKSKKAGIPFSLGTLLARIREEARLQSMGKAIRLDPKKKVFVPYSKQQIIEIEENIKKLEKNTITEKPENTEETEEIEKIEKIENTENTENEVLAAEEAHKDLNKEVFKRKRRRKHKKVNVEACSGRRADDLSWDYYETSVKAKPSHIRFDDNDEAMETKATENECNSLGESLNFSEASTGVNQQMVTIKSTFSVERNKSNEKHLAGDDICEKLIDSDEGGENINSPNDSEAERKNLNDSQQDAPDLDALKERVRHHKICLRFY